MGYHFCIKLSCNANVIVAQVSHLSSVMLRDNQLRLMCDLVFYVHRISWGCKAEETSNHCFSMIIIHAKVRNTCVICGGKWSTNVQPEAPGVCSWRKRSWKWTGWTQCRSSCRCLKSPPWKCKGYHLPGRQSVSCPAGWRWGIHWGSIGMTARLQRQRHNKTPPVNHDSGHIATAPERAEGIRCVSWLTLNNLHTCKKIKIAPFFSA